MLLAAGSPPIEYFSLSSHGNELLVLKTVPWEKVRLAIVHNNMSKNSNISKLSNMSETSKTKETC
jgi:hypothetical protein